MLLLLEILDFFLGEIMGNKLNKSKDKNKTEQWIPMKTQTLPMNDGIIIDDRIKAPLSNINDILKNIGCLVMTYLNIPNPQRRGTAVLLNACKYSNKYKCNIQYGLTAAHNVVYIDPVTELKMKPDFIEFEIRNNIKNHKSRIIHIFDVINVEIYPKYYDNPTEYSGYDIALIEIKDKNNILKNIKHIPIKSINIKHTNIAKIMGYPSKYKDSIITNWLYGMTGTYTIQKQQKLIEYSDINTSMGQNGSPIFSISENKNTMNNIYNNWSNVNIIGIHTGGNSFKNWGTNINKDIINWILTKIPEACQSTIFKSIDHEKRYQQTLNEIDEWYEWAEYFQDSELYRIPFVRHYTNYNGNDKLDHALADIRRFKVSVCMIHIFVHIYYNILIQAIAEATNQRLKEEISNLDDEIPHQRKTVNNIE